ncbi:helix-turn-helix transcriptional regulator [Azospira restricta]|uniref:Helix-turn-helix transcriptional regulator n=1 Tax=Azospira restricta TaxID=404405 RepID=A0A974SNX0_9RHOO|nr:helix-turn-helix transcriptional regulator [Azospira restricta]QRJ63743.1 helix-turn-helix transcriptional regulator [Azospira restricta]
MKIGLRIKQLREESGCSQGELARRVGVTQPTVSDWENNKTEPTVDNLRLLAVEFDVFFEWLATGRGPRQFAPGVGEPPAEYRVGRPLADDEAQLLAAFRRLPAARREALLEFLSRWA